MILNNLDTVVNFGFVLVAGNYSFSDTTIALKSGQGALLKDPAVFGQYNAAFLQYPIVSNIQLDNTKEIVRILNLTLDTVTIARAQEGTVATDKNTSPGGYVLVICPTSKLVDDANSIFLAIQNELNLQAGNIVDLQNVTDALQLQVGSQSLQIANVQAEVDDQALHLTTIDGEIVTMQSQVGSQSVHLTTIDGEIVILDGYAQMQSASITGLQYEIGLHDANLIILNNDVSDIYNQLGSQSIELQQHSQSITLLQQQAGSQSLIASNVTYTNGGYPLLTNVQKALDQLLYVSPAISGFSNNVGTVEIGSTVTAVTLNWSYNKTMTIATLTDAGSISPALLTYPFTGLSLTSNKTYTLTAGDGTNSTSANTTINFQNKRFWGTNANASVVDANILAMTQEFSTSRNKSFTINGNGQYIYYCYPASFGVATFTVNGLLSTAWTLSVQTFINAQGYSSSYNVYRTNTVQFGTGISIVVS